MFKFKTIKPNLATNQQLLDYIELLKMEIENTIDSIKTLPPWTAPVLLNEWVNYTDGNEYNTTGYIKDPLGFVHVKGIIKSGIANMGTVLFQLPQGYRPVLTSGFACWGENGAIRIDVNKLGNVFIGWGVTAGNWIFLDNIIFKAEQ